MGGWFLTPNQKLTKPVMSEDNLTVFEADPDGFVKCFLIRDECWIHHFKSETKRQSMHWRHLASSA